MDVPFRFEFVAPPDDLGPYVNTLFVFETELARLDDVLPAYSAQLISFGEGCATMQFGAGATGESNCAFFLAPMMRAAPFSMAGPVRACGASLTALGWAALAGLPVDSYGHRKIDAIDVVGEKEAAKVAEVGTAFAKGRIEAHDACQRLAEIVRSNLRPLNADHRAFIAKALEWLSSDFNPQIADLVRAADLSSRQIQRLCKRFFGKPPAALVKRYRAVRAATLLSQPRLDAAAREKVTAAFFDQAHMIRDIRYFTGRTPTNLGIGTNSVVSETLGPEGYGAVDLFGGGS